uniref:Apple domain-containing protein n=1 Tax=Trichuris muris TaxID=70415 RepID=A0A5S6R4F3_TRIMR
MISVHLPLYVLAACASWQGVQAYHQPLPPAYVPGPACRVDTSLIPTAEVSHVYSTASPANLKCGNMLQCYNSSHDTAMANGAPFERRSEISCEQCLKLCEEKRAPGRRYECRSVIYDYIRNVCDLYAVIGTTWPQCLASFKGYAHFRPIGKCALAAEPKAFQCRPPKKQKMIVVEGSVSTAPAFVSLGSRSKAECLVACEENWDESSNGLAIGDVCQVAMHARDECHLSSQPLDFRTLKEMPGGIVAAAKCFQDLEPCPYPFRLFQQRILVGYAKKVTDAGSVEDCIQQCLSVQKFHCNSGMFFLEDHGQNCILNTETATNKPFLFTSEDVYTVFYFDVSCNPDPSWTPVRAFREARAPTGVLAEISDPDKWTDWSPCSKVTYKRYRYKRCELKDIRRCEREVEDCSPDL